MARYRKLMPTRVFIAAVLLMYPFTYVNASESQSMRFAHMWPASSNWGQAVEEFSTLVHERTEGRYTVQVFPDGQLGNERENLESLQLGTLEFTFGGPGVMAGFDPSIGIFDMPFLFRDYEHANAVMDGPAGQQIFDTYLDGTGIRILASGAQGFRYVLTKANPVESIDDLANLKIRTPEAETFIRAFRALGANPVPVPWGETYLAFQTGVVDGMEGTPSVMRDFKMYEVGTFVAETRHIMASLHILVSEGVYSELPDDIKQAIMTSAKEAWAGARERALNEDLAALEELITQHGATVTTPDMSPVANDMETYWQEWAERAGAHELIDAVRNQ